jgi:hypothetical protein
MFGDFAVPGNPVSNKPIGAGELEDVTVAQALDYILQRYPGFWLYENCHDQGGGRSVYFNFF